MTVPESLTEVLQSTKAALDRHYNVKIDVDTLPGQENFKLFCYKNIFAKNIQNLGQNWQYEQNPYQNQGFLYLTRF